MVNNFNSILIITTQPELAFKFIFIEMNELINKYYLKFLFYPDKFFISL